MGYTASGGSEYFHVDEALRNPCTSIETNRLTSNCNLPPPISGLSRTVFMLELATFIGCNLTQMVSLFMNVCMFCKTLEERDISTCSHMPLVA